MLRLLLLLSVFITYPIFAQRLKVDVSASSAILINAETGAVLFEKNAHQPCFPASTTKVATALYTLNKIDSLDQRVVASSEAVACVGPQQRRAKHPSYRLEFGGTHMGIKVGEELSVRDLLHGLMLISANDAANVLAEHVSGSVPKFIEELNQFLKDNGCQKTNFYNPHGLPSQDHKTTAHDLAVMAKLAMAHPDFQEIVKTIRYAKPASNKQAETVFVQSNALLKPGPHYYPKAIGVKTGYTLSAGQNLVAAARDQGRFVIAVLLGCTDFHERYKDAIKLFETAFNEKKVSRTVFAKGGDLFSIKVAGAKTPLQGALNEDCVIEYFPSEEPAFKALLRWRELKLPIKKDDPVGEIQLVSLESGKVIKSATLHATETLVKTGYYQFLEILQKIKLVLTHKISLLFFTIAIFAALIRLFTKKRVEKREELL